MDNLRLILIVLGLIILAAIVLFHRPAGESRRNHARWLASRREPRISDVDTDVEASEPEEPRTRREPIVASRAEKPASTSNLAAGLAAAQVSSEASDDLRKVDDALTPLRGARVSAPEKIVTLYVQRKEGRRISGTELHDAAGKAGLDFGEMNIFHRLQEGASQPVFSMANLTAPGYFKPDGWSGFDTPGMTFFLTLPAPVSALDAWDAMLATARRMAELLDAEVLDDNRCLVTRQRIAQVRDEMREYDRRHGIGKSG